MYVTNSGLFPLTETIVNLTVVLGNLWRGGRAWLNAPHSKCGVRPSDRGFESLPLRNAKTSIHGSVVLQTHKILSFLRT